MSSLSEILSLTNSTEVISMESYIVNILAALLLGALLSLVIQYKNSISKSFAVTIAILPSVVCVVIMMVNGSIGTGVAVAGAFSLIRFRSVPGSGREIMAVFIAMAIGLTCAMGNLLYALIFTFLTTAGLLVLENAHFGRLFNESGQKVLRITIPENLDYTDIFDDLFFKYTKSHKLTLVRTTNMGSLFKLSYIVVLKKPSEEKELLDQIRVRNGNLEVSCSLVSTVNNEL